MKEKHYAYKINSNTTELVCTHAGIEEEKMLDLLKDIQKDKDKGIFWIFKQRDHQAKEPLCVVDCVAQRIYYHYSGDVEKLDDMIKKLTPH